MGACLQRDPRQGCPHPPTPPPAQDNRVPPPGPKGCKYQASFLRAGRGRPSPHHHCPVTAVRCPPLPANSVSALLHLRARPACLLMDTDHEASLRKRREGQRATGMKPEHAWLTKGPNRLGTDDLTSTATDQEQRKQARGSLLLEVISIHVVDRQMHPCHSPGTGSQRQG